MEETSEGTFVETCGVTAGLVASVAGPLLVEEVSGKAVGLQSLLVEEGSAWVLGLHKEVCTLTIDLVLLDLFFFSTTGNTIIHTLRHQLCGH